MPKWRFDRVMPFLMAVYPILFLYSINFYVIDPGAVLVTLIVSLVLAAVVLALCLVVFQNVQRALFVAGTTLFLFFTYGHAFDVAQTFRHAGLFPLDIDPVLLIVWAAAFIASIVFALRGEKFLPAINRYVGAITALLSLVALVNIGINAASASPPAKPITEIGADLHIPDSLPDIYYIILDEYTGPTALLDSFGFDNNQFLQFLESRGFYVAEDSHANYWSTRFSLASSLNMGYLDGLSGQRSDDPQPLYQMIQDNQVLHAVKELGYTYIQFTTISPVTHSNPYADILFNGSDFDLSEYHITLIDTTLLRPFLSSVQRDIARDRIQAKLEEMVRIAQLPEPTFTLAHFLLPHAPFIFSPEDGPENAEQPVDGVIVDQEKYATFPGYIDQVRFTNRVISPVIDDILSHSETEPIVIVQGDHGFRYLCDNCTEEMKTWGDENYYEVVLPVLNAYYLPGSAGDKLYQTISPVNSFRLIFDTYFGASLGLLVDRHFRPEYYYARTYEFIDITYLENER